MSPDRPVLAYRILHVENVALVAARGGLHAPSQAPQDGLVYRAIHNQSIQAQRGGREVPCGPGGSIEDYVSFYFGNRSPMLYQIATDRVPGTEPDQSRVIYAVTSVARVEEMGLRYVFTDGHSLATFSDWSDDRERLSGLDWETIGAKYWFDTPDDPDRQRRKQAELLVHGFVPLDALLGFATLTEEVRDEVTITLGEYRCTLPVAVRPRWYY